MERYNPFSSSNLSDTIEPFKTGSFEQESPKELRSYSTKFPDPFGEQQDTREADELLQRVKKTSITSNQFEDGHQTSRKAPPVPSRSGSVGAATTPAGSSSRSVDDPSSTSRLSRQASGLSSFLSRATSVTSSSVTDRVSEAVGSMRNAVDSISNQIQSAVPSSANPTGSSINQADPQQQQQQQSTASYLASKISSATVGQFTGSTGTGSQNSSSLPVISRQRVVLILDSYSSTDWPQHFNIYRRLTSGLSATSSPAQSALTYLFSSPQLNEGADLIEQADFRDVSILANQSSSTVTIYVGGSGNGSGGQRQQMPRIIRPEYVVVRQRTKDQLERLRSIVTALNYCLVPMFEPHEIWNTFQDRRLIFAKLLRVQKQLGKEQFPLIPQIFLQTHNDLLNYINSSQINLPCLVRIGPLGKGKIKVENLAMLQDFASILEASGQSCTIEQFLDIKCDLLVQKMGTNLKLFKRQVNKMQDFNDQNKQQPQFTRQSASRQTSLGSSVLSSIISSASGGQSSSASLQQQADKHQNLSRRSSGSTICGPFERISEVSSRYRKWIDAIAREFDNKLEAFCIKIVVANNDREYIVGLSDCSLDFLGNADNQEEDRRNFVELIVGHMNTLLPKSMSSSQQQQQQQHELLARRVSGGSQQNSPTRSIETSNLTSDKRKFASQTQIDSDFGGTSGNAPLRSNHPISGQLSGGSSSGSGSGRAYGQLGNRSKSVIVNQYEYNHRGSGPDQGSTQSPSAGFQLSNHNKSFTARRSSDRTDSLANDFDDLSGYATSSTTISDSQSSPFRGSGAGSEAQRQSSLGQTFLDQTSTAFSSFQKQSMSFFKRLDGAGSRLGGDQISSTPPLSAKSEGSFERGFGAHSTSGISAGQSIAGASDGGFTSGSGGASNVRNGIKSQSIDSSSMGASSSLQRLNSQKSRPSPPKPPPPASLGARQSSLANYSTRSPTGQQRPTTTPNSTPVQTRQNSAISDGTEEAASPGSGRGRVMRQNSALSAFEPFDPELRNSSTISTSVEEDIQAAGKDAAAVRSPLIASGTTRGSIDLHAAPVAASGSRQSSVGAIKPSAYDSASITSADSGSTTGVEDTMNNLKKTFASIFGDKCE